MYGPSLFRVLVTLVVAYPFCTYGAESPQLISGAQNLGSNVDISNKFILELSDTSLTQSAVTSSLEKVYVSLRARDLNFTVTKEYHATGLFNGVSLTVSEPDAFTISSLENLPGVLAVMQARSYQLPRFSTPNETLSSSTPYENFAMYAATGIDRVHALNNFGKDVTIGLIGSGINYKLPIMGGGLGPGRKVIGGRDFVRGNEDPADCYGSGTFYAALIGANPDSALNIKGIAHLASLRAYKVTDCYGSWNVNTMLDAIEKAAEDKVDILVIPSFGTPTGLSNPLFSRIFSRLLASGIVVFGGAGDYGEHGSFTSLPTASSGLFSVGSLNNDVIASAVAIVGGASHTSIPYSSFNGFAHTDALPIYVISLDGPECNFPTGVPLLTSYAVILYFKPPCSDFELLYEVSENYGATYILAYSDNDPNGILIDFVPKISLTDGKWLRSQFLARVPITLSFPPRVTGDGGSDSNAGLVADSSGQGLTSELPLSLGARLIAPGQHIVSLNAAGSSLRLTKLSGTDVASVFLAGCAALLLSAKNRTLEASDVLARLQTTANKIPSANKESALLETITRQGAGLVDVAKAISYATKINPATLSLGDLDTFKDTHMITITNEGKEKQSYTLRHVPAGTALTTKADSPRILQKLVLTTSFIGVRFSETNFSLGPSESKTLTVQFTLPPNNDPKLNAIYSGFVEVISARETLHSAYFALGSSLKTRKLIDRQPGEFLTPTWGDPNAHDNLTVQLPSLTDEYGWPLTGNLVFNLKSSRSPILAVSLLSSTRTVIWELVDVNFKAPVFESGSAPKEGLNVVGIVHSFVDVPRNTWMPDYRASYLSAVPPAFENGTMIPTGMFRCLLRVLKPMGDKGNLADFEYWVSSGTITFVS